MKRSDWRRAKVVERDAMFCEKKAGLWGGALGAGAVLVASMSAVRRA